MSSQLLTVTPARLAALDPAGVGRHRLRLVGSIRAPATASSCCGPNWTGWNRDFTTPLAAARLIDWAYWGARLLYRWSGLEGVVRWVVSDPPALWSGLEVLRVALRHLGEYLLAAAYITQLVGARLAVVLLALPAYALIGVMGAVDGLVQRDLRRFGGGAESGFMYHHLKTAVRPLFSVPVFLYLISPWSVHPTLVFVPFALGFGYVVQRTLARVQKILVRGGSPMSYSNRANPVPPLLAVALFVLVVVLVWMGVKPALADAGADRDRPAPRPLLAERRRNAGATAGAVERSAVQFEAVYAPLLAALAGYVQRLPARRDRRTTFWTRGWRRPSACLARRRGMILPPSAEPERAAREADLWTYALFGLALLRGLAGAFAPWAVALWSADGGRSDAGVRTSNRAGLARVTRARRPTPRGPRRRAGADWTPLVAGALLPRRDSTGCGASPGSWRSGNTALIAADLPPRSAVCSMTPRGPDRIRPPIQNEEPSESPGVGPQPRAVVATRSNAGHPSRPQNLQPHLSAGRGGAVSGRGHRPPARSRQPRLRRRNRPGQRRHRPRAGPAGRHLPTGRRRIEKRRKAGPDAPAEGPGRSATPTRSRSS